MARFRRKDLKRPDAFVSTSQRAFEWGFEHQRELMIAGAGLVLVLVLVGGYTALGSARQRQANDDLARALGAFRAEKYPEAAKQLETVADAWDSTGAGKLARLYLADAQLAAGQSEPAAVELEKVLADPLAAEYLNQQARLNLGVARERKQDLVGAAEQYAKAAEMKGPYRALALLRAARVRDKLADQKGAVELYETFVREYPGAPDVALVEARLQALRQPAASDL
jgi:hypothetical protein